MKRFLTAIAFLIVTTFSFAQTAIGIKVASPYNTGNFTSAVKSNIEGGITLSEPLRFFPPGYYPSLLSSGVFVRTHLKNRWHLQIEVLYKREGVWYYRNRQLEEEKKQDTISVWSPNKHASYEWDYIDIPMSFQWEANGAPLRLVGEVGLSPKFLVRAVYETDQPEGGDITYKVQSSFNPVVLNWHLGAGLILDKERWIWLFQTRLSNSFTPITSKRGTPDINLKHIKTHHVAFTVSVGYKLSKKMRTIPQEELPTITNDSIPAEVNTSQEQDF